MEKSNQEKDSKALLAHKRAQSRMSSAKHRLRQQMLTEELANKEKSLKQRNKDLKTENDETKDRIALLKNFGYGKQEHARAAMTVISLPAALSASTMTSSPSRSFNSQQSLMISTEDDSSISLGSTITSSTAFASIVSNTRPPKDIPAQGALPMTSSEVDLLSSLTQAAAKVKVQVQLEALLRQEQQRLEQVKQEAERKQLLLTLLLRLEQTKAQQAVVSPPLATTYAPAPASFVPSFAGLAGSVRPPSQVISGGGNHNNSTADEIMLHLLRNATAGSSGATTTVSLPTSSEASTYASLPSPPMDTKRLLETVLLQRLRQQLNDALL